MINQLLANKTAELLREFEKLSVKTKGATALVNSFHNLSKAMTWLRQGDKPKFMRMISFIIEEINTAKIKLPPKTMNQLNEILMLGTSLPEIGKYNVILTNND